MPSITHPRTSILVVPACGPGVLPPAAPTHYSLFLTDIISVFLATGFGAKSRYTKKRKLMPNKRTEMNPKEMQVEDSAGGWVVERMNLMLPNFLIPWILNPIPRELRRWTKANGTNSRRQCTKRPGSNQEDICIPLPNFMSLCSGLRQLWRGSLWECLTTCWEPKFCPFSIWNLPVILTRYFATFSLHLVVNYPLWLLAE